MDRREMLTIFGATLLGAGATGASPQNERDGHSDLIRNPSLFDASVVCSKAAELCVGHCVEMFARGDKSLIVCARNSREVLVVSNALRALAAQSSPHLAQFARLSAEICRSCEAECRKHPQHSTCKNCADACAGCADECKKFVDVNATS
jgi:Cys-rich four helix bundle protein (predicted Tat secretion target)